MDYLRESDDIRREIAIARNMIRNCDKKLDELNKVWAQNILKKKILPACNVLTQREYQVFELMRQNFSNSEIESELGLGKKTINACAEMILEKLDCINRAELSRIEL